jgi:hypothetical protein
MRWYRFLHATGLGISTIFSWAAWSAEEPASSSPAPPDKPPAAESRTGAAAMSVQTFTVGQPFQADGRRTFFPRRSVLPGLVRLEGLPQAGPIIPFTVTTAGQESDPATPDESDKSDAKTDGAGDQPKACDSSKAKTCPSFWEKYPPVRLLPRTGFFQIFPTGPGYYSLHDVVMDEYRQKPPNFPYSRLSFIQPSFFDADFRYLENPKNKQFDIFDGLHTMHFGNCWKFSTGGEFRYRHESQISGPRLNGQPNNFDLFRTRVYGDLWYGNLFRTYVEYIDANITGNAFAPFPADQNRSDLLNAFGDLRLLEGDGYPAYLRVGRQEMLLGSQRLISTLDWANTRRTFQGARAFRQGEKFDVDVFYVQPVLIHPYKFDWVDNNQHFAGAWFTKRPQKGETIDTYWLYYDNTNRVNLQGVVIDPTVIHTMGARWAGDQTRGGCDSPFKVLWDFEGMMQIGTRGVNDLCAGAATASLGANYSGGLNPTFWLCYDYASGSHDGSGQNTFNQLFPFSHLYLGWIDAVGRQNIHDLNMHLYLNPTKWITLWTQYHHFWLASPNDALYNAAGNAIRRDPTGRAGTNVGDELDFVLNFHLGAHSDLAFGWSQLFPGNFITSTGPGRPPQLYFLQYSFRW